MSYMYMHSTHAHALHKRTSLRTPPRAAERSMAVVMAATAAARPPTVDLRPLAAMAATSERPARVGMGTGQYVAAGWLGGRAAEFERWRRRCAPYHAEKSRACLRMMVEELQWNLSQKDLGQVPSEHPRSLPKAVPDALPVRRESRCASSSQLQQPVKTRRGRHPDPASVPSAVARARLLPESSLMWWRRAPVGESHLLAHTAATGQPFSLASAEGAAWATHLRARAPRQRNLAVGRRRQRRRCTCVHLCLSFEPEKW